jgi:type I restriction enzyme S subunit
MQRLKRSVLAKAFRGELVRTEASLAEVDGRQFESAEELLTRIRHGREGQSSLVEESAKLTKRRSGASN